MHGDDVALKLCRNRSDIGHFDVVNMNEVLMEAHELVDEGLIKDEDFRDFVFANPVHFFGDMNPDFFRNTTLESAAAELLANTTPRP